MGKPFESELKEVRSTLEWVFDLDVPGGGALWHDSKLPAYCVGSGGSMSSADFLARLIRQAGGFAYATTPLEFMGPRRELDHCAVFLLSAGGRNKDILASAEYAIRNEVDLLAALCMRASTPLGNVVSGYARGVAIGLEMPAGKDGFLATNSLISTMGALMKMTGFAPSRAERDRLTRTANDIGEEVPAGEELPLKEELLIVYGGWAGPAATDLESKLSEAALIPSLLCDYRNFGHGRHVWLAKRSQRTTIVALTDPPTKELAERTMKLVPCEVPVQWVDTDCSGPCASLDLTMKCLRLVNSIGKWRGIDPGRPGVPEFGRKLYHLSPGLSKTKKEDVVSLAVRRRIRTLPSSTPEIKIELESHARKYLARLQQAELSGIVFDFDGTLVNTFQRFDPMPLMVKSELNRLLGTGMKVGVATGRGKSVREQLRQGIEREFWPGVCVGYYNGSQRLFLADDSLPDNTEPSSGALFELRSKLASDTWFKKLCRLELRPGQLTIEAGRCNKDLLWKRVMEVLSCTGATGLRCVTSSHSVDVLDESVSKLALVREMQGNADGEILCVGDSGYWPGNDCELMEHYPSLSCGSPGRSMETGWNFAPMGMVEADATAFYLRQIGFSGTFKINLEH